MNMQYEMRKLVRSIESAALRGLECIQKNIRVFTAPAGKGVYIFVPLGQRENADALCFEQLCHMGDWPRTYAPIVAQSRCRSLRTLIA